MKRLQEASAAKGQNFVDVIMMGRTQLQDTVPMTLGQEFGAWAVMVGEDMARVRGVQSLIHKSKM
jgi:aspartate ammonia-lyase